MKYFSLFFLFFTVSGCLEKNTEYPNLFNNARLQDSLNIYIESVMSLPRDSVVPNIMDIFIYDIKQDRYIVLDTYADAEKALPVETWNGEVSFKSLRPGIYKGVITRVSYTPGCKRLVNKSVIKAFPRNFMRHQPWTHKGEISPLPYVYRKYKLLSNGELMFIPDNHICSY